MKADLYTTCAVRLLLAAGLLFSGSCSDDESGPAAGIPYKAIRVTVDSETVTAVQTDAKNLALNFDTAENFNDARIDVDLNDGYSILFPTDVGHADLDTYPVLNFRAPDKRIVKVWFTISSKAFPVTDGSKVTAAGMSGCVSVTGKTISILYTPGMDRSAITLGFGEGSLMEGAAIASATTFDFTQSLVHTLAVDMAGKERLYSVKIDYSKVMAKPMVYGFSKVTKDYLDAAACPFVSVYKATSVNGVPVRGAATAETPWEWDSSEPDVYCAFIGNWVPDRPTETIEGIEFAFATIDTDKARAYMVSNDAHAITMADVNGLISLSGMMLNEKTIVYYDGRALTTENSESAWRSMAGFYEDGHVEFWHAGLHDGTLVKAGQWNDDNWAAENQGAYLAAGTPWEVRSAASGHPWLVRDGRLLTRVEMYHNDTGWGTALGEGWNGTRTRSYIGLTYDNKLGVAAVSEGTGTCQAAWLLYKMGWKDVFYVAGSNYLDDSFKTTLKVNGKVVVGAADQAAQYGIAIDVKQ